MKPIQKLFSVLALLAIVTITCATPAHAFDGRTGDEVVIKAEEAIDDDLYVTARVFTLDGTVNGDLVVFAQTITVNGAVNGDLIAAGQVVIINGTVTDDARIAGAALQVGETASIGSDLVAAGASLEAIDGSTIEGELVFGGAQAFLAGDVAGDVMAGTAALKLSGTFGGDIHADVGEANQAGGPPPSMYMPQTGVSMPSVPPGLTISKDAKIAGNLEYTQTKDIEIPAGVVAGKVIRTMPEAGETTREVQPTPAQQVGKWALDLLRGMVTLILFGLLLGWLFPFFMRALPEEIKAHPWSSLGWGVIAWAAFFFGLLVIVLGMIIGGLIFGFLTLGGVSGTIVWLGILALIVLTILFVLVTSFLTKIVVGELMGKWILSRTNPALAEHKVWPMVVGVVVLVMIIGLFRFPLLPLGFFGWLINFLVILCGLGALWLWGREKFARKPVSTVG